MTRPGAGAVYIHCHHFDLMSVLDTKRENADEKVRIKTLSLGVVLTDVFWKAYAEEKTYYAFSTYDIEKHYGKAFADMDITANYEKLVNDQRIGKRSFDPEQILEQMAQIAGESGYPYILNIDTANRANPIKGMVNMSNLCVHGDTLLATSKGQFPISTLENKDVEVWNGEQWSKTTVVKTGTAQKLIGVKLSDGKVLESTEYHKWYIRDKTGAQVQTRTQLLKVGDVIAGYVDDIGVGIDDATVVEIYDVEGLHDTYCVKEPLRAKAVFNGILTGNCSEILQVNKPTIYNPDGSAKELGQDISCNLGSINIYEIMHQGMFAKTIEVATRALSTVATLSNIQSVPSIVAGNKALRAIGLGAMNFQGFIASEKIHYDSPEAVDFADFYFMVMNYHSLRASMKLAIENTPFEGFEDSKYASGEYFDYYLKRSHEPKTQTVKDIFAKYKVAIPTREDWALLCEEVKKNGLYNAYRMAVAPTGSISYVNYATSCIHPISMRMERRDEGKIGSVYAPAPYLNDENKEYYKNTYEVGAQAVINVYGAATPHVDQGLSLTLGYTTGTTTGDVKDSYIKGYLAGVKTMYYVRVQKADLPGTELAACMACEV